MYPLKTKHFIFLILLLLALPGSAYSQIEFTSSNLPIITIITNGQEILDDPRILATMTVINNEKKRNYLSDSIYEYYGTISIEIRGSTSQSFPKKQYAIETQNNDGSNNNVSLLGLPAENDWILAAPYSDKTLIRNILAFKLSESLGHYAPRTRLCELFLNNQYQGVYVLTENIKRDKNRVNIAKTEPEDVTGDDVTGGYIVKIDKSTGSNCFGWNTSLGSIYFQYEYPKCNSIVNEQKAYIKNHISYFEDALFSDDFMDTLWGYKPFINLNSALDYFFVNEISKNIDAYRLSTYIFKDKDSKDGRLNFGPVWDYNIAFGNADYNDGHLTDGLIAPSHIWWERFLQDSIFTMNLKKRWSNIRNANFSNNNIINLIDSLTYILDEAQERNFKKWDILENKIWPNYYVGGSYKAEISFLKSWIINRLNWLDNNMPGYYKYYNPYAELKTTIYPNPFNYFFTFNFLLEQSGNVSIYLINSKGQHVTHIINNSFLEKGQHKITWNSFIGKNNIPPSFYILILEIDGVIVHREKIIKKN